MRSYGTPQQVFGGKPDCKHEFEDFKRISENKRNNENTMQPKAYYKDQIQGKCNLCGAWRGEYGNEPTMEMYLENTLAWIKEVWRVLKPTGSFVLNIGDCFIGGGRGGASESTSTFGAGAASNVPSPPSWAELKKQGTVGNLGGIYKPKQLLSVSSFAYCRIVSETDFVCRGEHLWLKPNIPSPIRSRLKHSHEKLFWFVKDADKYYFDNKAWIKQNKQNTIERMKYNAVWDKDGQIAQRNLIKAKDYSKKETIEHSWRIIPVGERQNGFELAGKRQSEHIAPFPTALIKPYILSLCPPDGVVLDPFLGSGTTMRVAMEEGRSAIGIELNESYVKYAKKRLNWGSGLDVEYAEETPRHEQIQLEK